MIDLRYETWTATILPHPKRYVRSKAVGFCGGFAVGSAETGAGGSAACWWPRGEPALLVLDGKKELRALFARGNTIPGSWNRSRTGKSGAVAWRLDAGVLSGCDLHDDRFETTWAEGAGAGLVVGVGTHKGKLGNRPRNSGVVWEETGAVTEIVGAESVSLCATDGTRLAGSIGGRAALWPSFGAAPVDLAPVNMPASEVHALDGALQVGYAFDADAAHAMIWRGSADSAQDLTPDGFAEARAFDGANGYQVGFVRTRTHTPGGTAALDNRAVIWNGAADRRCDLNALLPEPFNASTAWAICFTDDSVLVCGEALRVERRDAGTARETHAMAMSQAVVWKAPLTGERS